MSGAGLGYVPPVTFEAYAGKRRSWPMAAGESDSVWGRLGAALEGAGPASAAAGGYPRLAGAHPVFQAVEQVGDRWLFLGLEASITPQDARDDLAHQFLVRAAAAEEGSQEQERYRAAARVLDRERHDELTAAGRRFRIARAGQVLRTGLDGPEPPRPEESRRPGPDPAGSRPVHRFIGDADTDAGPSSASLRAWLQDSVTRPGARPPEVIADERQARARYPQVILLGTWFAVAERTGGAWEQPWPREHVTPARAREWLASWFRDYVPAWEKPGLQACAAYAEAAGILERDSADEVAAAGRRSASSGSSA
jgi:Family of unknown function (DUF5954)